MVSCECLVALMEVFSFYMLVQRTVGLAAVLLSCVQTALEMRNWLYGLKVRITGPLRDGMCVP